MLRVVLIACLGLKAVDACSSLTTSTGCSAVATSTNSDVMITYNNAISGTTYASGTTATVTCNGIGTNKNLYDGTTAYTSAQTLTCTNGAWSNTGTFFCGCARPTSPASNFWVTNFMTTSVVATGSVFAIDFDAQCAATVGSASTSDWATVAGTNYGDGSRYIVTCTNDGTFTIVIVDPTSSTATTVATQTSNPTVACQATQN